MNRSNCFGMENGQITAVISREEEASRQKTVAKTSLNIMYSMY